MNFIYHQQELGDKLFGLKKPLCAGVMQVMLIIQCSQVKFELRSAQF